MRSSGSRGNAARQHKREDIVAAQSCPRRRRPRPHGNDGGPAVPSLPSAARLLSVAVPFAIAAAPRPAGAMCRTLPRPPPRGPIVIGYAHDPASGRAERALRDGAAAIVWSFLHLELESDDDDEDACELSKRQTRPRGRIRTDLDLGEIRRIRDGNGSVVHLAAFGGWNGRHPPPASLTGREWFEVFADFNSSHGDLFDGIDWDYEGHDDLHSPTARFTLETLDVVADFSVEAKRRGMIVTMAPAESYLDATVDPGSVDARFSLRLDLPPRSWTTDRYHATDADRDLVESAGFSHAGRQCYAYVLAKAGIETFDWIAIQLYEAYSPFAHDVGRRGVDPSEAIQERIRRLAEGYTVTNLPLPGGEEEYTVRVPPHKLVIGIANGWADGVKFRTVEPAALRIAHETTLAERGEGFRGVMFWTVEEEGEEGEDNSRLARRLGKEFGRGGRPSPGGAADARADGTTAERP